METEGRRDRERGGMSSPLEDSNFPNAKLTREKTFPASFHEGEYAFAGRTCENLGPDLQQKSAPTPTATKLDTLGGFHI